MKELKKLASKPRGVRNHNPLNLRKGTAWKGLDIAGCNREREFCVFKTDVWGFRAAFITLRTYYNKHHLKTLSGIIQRWAPPSENATVNYIKYVSMMTGIDPNQSLPPVTYDSKTWVEIALAMAQVENGTVPPTYRRYAELGLLLI